MEALTAASVAALTVYDMVKGVERGAEIAWCRCCEVRRALGRLAPTRRALRPPAQPPATPRCMMKTAILTVSTSVAAGQTEDRSGAALAEHAEAAGAEVVARDVLPDDRAAIEDWLRRQAAGGALADLHHRRHRAHRRRRHPGGDARR